MTFGVFVFIFGGYDDSPGAQGLGLLIFIGGIINIVKKRKSASTVSSDKFNI